MTKFQSISITDNEGSWIGDSQRVEINRTKHGYEANLYCNYRRYEYLTDRRWRWRYKAIKRAAENMLASERRHPVSQRVVEVIYPLDEPAGRGDN